MQQSTGLIHNSVVLLMQSFETMFSEIKSKCEALEAENARLRDAICLPDIQVLFGMMHMPVFMPVCVCVCMRACVRVCV